MLNITNDFNEENIYNLIIFGMKNIGIEINKNNIKINEAMPFKVYYETYFNTSGAVFYKKIYGYPKELSEHLPPTWIFSTNFNTQNPKSKYKIQGMENQYRIHIDQNGNVEEIFIFNKEFKKYNLDFYYKKRNGVPYSASKCISKLDRYRNVCRDEENYNIDSNTDIEKLFKQMQMTYYKLAYQKLFIEITKTNRLKKVLESENIDEYITIFEMITGV